MATIRKREGPGGRRAWHAQVRKKGYPHQTCTFDTKSAALRWVSSIESEMARGVFVSRAEAENTTLAGALRRYLSEVTPGKKGRVQEHSRIDGLLADPISSLSLAALDGAAVAEYRDRRLESVGPKTVRNDPVLLQHVLAVAD